MSIKKLSINTKRNIFIFSKTNWANIKLDMKNLSETVTFKATNQHSTVQSLWNTFKSGVEKSMTTDIPTKISKKRRSLPWLSKTLTRMTRRKVYIGCSSKPNSPTSGAPSSYSRRTANRSLRKLRLSTDWGNDFVSFVFKKGDVHRAENYMFPDQRNM